MDDDGDFRGSMLAEEVEEDRRLIMRKIQARRRQNRLARSQALDADAIDDAASAAAGHSRRVSEATGLSTYADDGEIMVMDSSFDEDLIEMQAAHEEDEQLIGGRIEECGANEEENLEAMNQALTSPPVAWWAMRKQWQKRRGELNLVGGVGTFGAGNRSGDDVPEVGEEEVMVEGPDGAYWDAGPSTDAGLVGHPVLLDDPSSLGFDQNAYRQNPYSTRDKRKRGPTWVYVSHKELQKRKMQQMMYIVASLCVVFLFMFLLEQRKLSHYAMVESPISLSAYLAGEHLAEKEETMKLGDLGLEQFGKVHVPDLDFSNIEIDPGDPLANEELANDPLVGNHPTEEIAHVHGSERYEMLKKIVVGWQVTPAEVLENHSSPQHMALHWMAYDDGLRYTPDNDHLIKKIVQRYTLATLYYSTNGSAWTNTLFFLSNADECNWNWNHMLDPTDHGLHFKGVGHCEDGIITALALWSNNLSGALPPEVGSLTSLRTFSVFDNRLTLPPPKPLAKLTNLDRLYLQRNKFRADVNFLCPIGAEDFKADCGSRGKVGCSCCSACGYRDSDKAAMVASQFV
ncbi:hypothetical protein ACHAXT_011562 [Thalassiosira profunda]